MYVAHLTGIDFIKYFDYPVLKNKFNNHLKKKLQSSK